MTHNCWNQIGVQGDRTCPELETVIHCQNCSVYSQAGRSLLDRPAPEGYVAEWTALLGQPPQQTDYRTIVSVAIFRLGQEWLALPATVFNQVLEPAPVHSLPHRSDRILRGIVNVRGQILLCVSLHDLLGIAAAPNAAVSSKATVHQTSGHSIMGHSVAGYPVVGHSTTADPAAKLAQTANRSTVSSSVNSTVSSTVGCYPRLVVVEKQRDLWAFNVDEFYGLHRCQTDQLQKAPAFSSQSLAGFTQSILPWHNQNVSYLDADCLFNALRQQAL